uniref:Uncharacterized protein n=1 Tax=Meloidogyne hapla TaxID=6305 RepID=A0A1I8BLJ1_MELHA
MLDDSGRTGAATESSCSDAISAEFPSDREKQKTMIWALSVKKFIIYQQRMLISKNIKDATNLQRRMQ